MWWPLRTTDIYVKIWKCTDVTGFTGDNFFVAALYYARTQMHEWYQEIIGLGNGLASVRCQATDWNNTELLSMASNPGFNTLRPRQNRRHYADDIFKSIFLNENARISLTISLKLVPKFQINNIPALVQITGQATSHYLNQW